MPTTQVIVERSDTGKITEWLMTIFNPEAKKESEMFRLIIDGTSAIEVITPVLADEESCYESIVPYFYELLASESVQLVVKKRTFLYHNKEVHMVEDYLRKMKTLKEDDSGIQIFLGQPETWRKVERRLVYR